MLSDLDNMLERSDDSFLDFRIISEKRESCAYLSILISLNNEEIESGGDGRIDVPGKIQFVQPLLYRSH